MTLIVTLALGKRTVFTNEFTDFFGTGFDTPPPTRLPEYYP